VLRLTNYIFALSVAYWLEGETQAATQALVTFPVNPNVPPSPIPTMSEAQVIFSGALGLDVAAAYFYALNYDLSALLNQDSLQQKQTRQQVVYGADQQDNLNGLTSALNAGLISLPAALNPAQAARIIEALNIPAASSAGIYPIAAVSLTPIFQAGWVLFETGWAGQPSWLNFPLLADWTTYQSGDDVAGFWQPLAAAQPGAFLDIVLMALTQGFMVGATPLAELLVTDLGLANVAGGHAGAVAGVLQCKSGVSTAFHAARNDRGADRRVHSVGAEILPAQRPCICAPGGAGLHSTALRRADVRRHRANDGGLSWLLPRHGDRSRDTGSRCGARGAR
jgi:hypothetical protein